MDGKLMVSLVVYTEDVEGNVVAAPDELRTELEPLTDLELVAHRPRWKNQGSSLVNTSVHYELR